MPHEFTLSHRVEFSETDMAGIVHFANFYRMMENAEHAFFRSLGFTIHGHEAGTTTGWPRVNAACEFFKPLRFEEIVDIQLLVADEKVVASAGEEHGLPKTPQAFSVSGSAVVKVRLSTDNRFGNTVWATWNSLPVAEFEIER